MRGWGGVGWEVFPLQWKLGVLTTGLPGKSLWLCAFIFYTEIPRSGMARSYEGWSYGSYVMFNFLKNCQTVSKVVTLFYIPTSRVGKV